MKPIHVVQLQSRNREDAYVVDVAHSRGGRYLAFATSQRRIEIFDPASACVVRAVSSHTARVTDLAASANDPFLLFSAQEDGAVVATDVRAPGPAGALPSADALHRILAALPGDAASGEAVEAKGGCRESDASCFALAVDPCARGGGSAALLAHGLGGDIRLVDTRVWRPARVLSEIHADDVTRLRYTSGAHQPTPQKPASRQTKPTEGEDGSRSDSPRENAPPSTRGDRVVLCSGGEDQVVNVLDPWAPCDDDVLLGCLVTGEPPTRMAYFPARGVLGVVGACENALLCDVGSIAASSEDSNARSDQRRFPRRDEATYTVDFVEWPTSAGDGAGSLFLLCGRHNADDDAAQSSGATKPARKGKQTVHFPPLDIMPLAEPGVAAVPRLVLAGVHTDVVRCAVTIDGPCLVTGGEDGRIVWWAESDDL